MASYPDVLKVAENLGGSRILREKLSTVADLERAVGKGFPFAALKHVVRHFPERQKTRVQQIVMPRSTLRRGGKRRVASGPLKASDSNASLGWQHWPSMCGSHRRRRSGS